MRAYYPNDDAFTSHIAEYGPHVCVNSARMRPSSRLLQTVRAGSGGSNRRPLALSGEHTQCSAPQRPNRPISDPDTAIAERTTTAGGDGGDGGVGSTTGVSERLFALQPELTPPLKWHV